jgi:hypothetical protein
MHPEWGERVFGVGTYLLLKSWSSEDILPAYSQLNTPQSQSQGGLENVFPPCAEEKETGFG